MKVIGRQCIETGCPSMKGGDPCAHEIYGIELGQETPFGRMASQYKIRCLSCLKEKLEIIPKRRVYRRTWPHHNDSCGVTFESESHEQKFVKENNLTTADN